MDQAILKTLIYADLFDFPLTKNEIWQRLIWENNRTRPRQKDFNLRLKLLLGKGVAVQNGQFFFLKGREKLTAIRKNREQESAKKISRALKIANFLRLVSTIKLIGLTGGVAANNAKPDDDIDLLIITSSGRVWTTRFLVTLILSFLGLRRLPNEDKAANKICLNLFLDESHLDFFSKDGDLFLACEIAQLRSLWQKGNIYSQFLSANSWVKNFLPNAFDKHKFSFIQKPMSKYHRQSDRIIDLPWGLIERFFYCFQLWWMKKRKTVEITEPDLIAFHPKSIRKKIIDKFNQRCKAYLGSTSFRVLAKRDEESSEA